MQFALLTLKVVREKHVNKDMSTRCYFTVCLNICIGVIQYYSLIVLNVGGNIGYPIFFISC